jgi:hypothetical protein
MKSAESSMAGGVGLFHTTRWTLVMASAHDQSQTGRAALAALCQIYWTRYTLLRAGAVIHRTMPRM